MFYFLRILLLMIAIIFVPVSAQAAAPEKVFVGAHINDIQALDLQGHNYRLDIYVWFRWKDPAIDPSRTAEFMNAYDPADHVRTVIYKKPLKMPDGSYYTIIRNQGKFSAKFPLHQYPFDRQNLVVLMEDNTHAANELVYVQDPVTPISMSEGVSLPGFEVETPSMNIRNFLYPTKFGDISQKEPSFYSRASFEVPVMRPHISSAIKIFLPVILIIICTGMIFFVHPAYIEGRLGVAITALLTLVALQLTTASSLPDVNYLLTTDKVYLLSYLFIIATLLQMVRKSRQVYEKKYDGVLASDRHVLRVLFILFTVGMAVILLSAL